MDRYIEETIEEIIEDGIEDDLISIDEDGIEDSTDSKNDNKLTTGLKLSNNCTKIIPRDKLKNTCLDWGNNGIGNRFANGKFNHISIYKKSYKLYFEDECILQEDDIRKIQSFQEEYKNVKSRGIIGIMTKSIRKNKESSRPISDDIREHFKNKPCVVCGSKSEIVPDHKNDLYNNERVLDKKTQEISDFQPLCNHCNLQKRQISRKTKENKKIYSAKNIPQYNIYPFDFPWEKKNFDIDDKNCLNDTYWYDPVEFNKKIIKYMLYVYPFLNEIRSKLQ